MPRPKTKTAILRSEIKSLTYTNHTQAEQIKQRDQLIAVLQEDNNKRDRLIQMMKNDHTRTVQVGHIKSNQVKAITTFIESFQNNWEGFKVNALNPDATKDEFDEVSHKNSHEITQAYRAIYTMGGVGQITSAKDLSN